MNWTEDFQPDLVSVNDPNIIILYFPHIIPVNSIYMLMTFATYDYKADEKNKDKLFHVFKIWL